LDSNKADVESRVKMDSRIQPWRDQVQTWWEDQQSDRNKLAEGGFYWLQEDSFVVRQPFDWVGTRTKPDLVKELKTVARFSVIDAARATNKPQNKIALVIAESLLPAPYADEMKLLVDVINAAATENLKLRKRYVWSGIGTTLLLIAYFNGWGRPNGVPT
jgi:hypothetical protein